MSKILHLSDIHFGRNYSEYNEDGVFDRKELILEELIECISKMDKKPEHIIVTGDIAWWGKEKDFNEALKWFEKLLKELSLRGSDITFCPGNHDINRNYGYYRCDITKDTKVKDIDELYDYSNVHKMEEPLYNYDEFCAKLGVIPFHYPKNSKQESSYSIGYKDIELEENRKIRIVSFNTALLSYLKDYPDDANFIGKKQIEDLLNYKILGDSEIYTIAIFHHAERFLHKNEICEYDGREATLPKLRKSANLILCGHTETGGRPVLYQQSNGAYMLTGGAAYFDDLHPNAYSLIEIKDESKKPEIYPYTYENNKWKEYKEHQKKIKKLEMKIIPDIGVIRGRGIFEMNLGLDKHIIKINNLRICEKDEEYCYLDNEDDPTRLINIKSCAPIKNKGNSYFEIEQSNLKSSSVRARLETLKSFEFINKAKNSSEKSSFKIYNSSGQVYYSVEKIEGNIQYQGEWIEILEKLKRIEDYFDIRIQCPQECNSDLINKIIDLIDGKEVSMPNFQQVTVPFDDVKKIKEFLHSIRLNKKIYLVNDSIYYCDLFGKQFSLGKLKMVSGPYTVNRLDACYKILTFGSGDIRKLTFNKCDNTQTYIFIDKGDFVLRKPFIKINLKAKWNDSIWAEK